MKKVYIILFLVNFSSYANNCNDAVKVIYQNIITSIGNNSLYPPELHFSDETRSVAYMSSKGITIEQKTIDLFCGKDNFEDKIAYIIAHELAHYYLEHSWMSNTGLSYASSIGEFVEDSSSLYSAKQKKLSESQADLYAGFYGQIAGYNTLGFGEIALTEVYESYKLPKELNGYPSFDERIEILNSRIRKANNLALLFELGNVLLLSKQYNLAKECYETILKNKFNSREIYNNLGLAFLLYGISISEEDVANLLYPVYLDEQTRANISKTRSGDLFKDPKAMISMASILFNKALFLDPGYLPSKQNLLVSIFLEKENHTERTNFLEQSENDIVNNKVISDLKVINALLANVRIKRVKKMAKSASYISLLNTTEEIYNGPIISDEEVLKRLEIDITELLMGFSGKTIKGSNFSFKKIKEIEIFEHKDFYIFKIPTIKYNNLFNEKEKRGFRKLKGIGYYLYDTY
jgi:hypothetical protein